MRNTDVHEIGTARFYANFYGSGCFNFYKNSLLSSPSKRKQEEKKKTLTSIVEKFFF